MKKMLSKFVNVIEFLLNANQISSNEKRKGPDLLYIAFNPTP